MSSDESDAGPHHKRKRKISRINDSPENTSSSSGSPVIGSSSSRSRSGRRVSRRNPINTDSDTSSNSGSSIVIRCRKKIMKVESDSEEESSDSSFIRRTSGRTRRLSSDSGEGSSSSQWDTDDENVPRSGKSNMASVSPIREHNKAIDSDSSDGCLEKCPICLLSFKKQEIGTPESCDHMFCLECIREWSKNMNTCPVDRQEYNLILVRLSLDGKVVRRIQIEKPVPQNELEIQEDPTFCEICGNSDREDAMLLCDGCDMGFHMHCLDPPLNEVPEGLWYCNDCSPYGAFQNEVDFDEVQLLLDDAQMEDNSQVMLRGRRRSTRMIPRTRFNERVRRRIATNRQLNSSFQENYPSDIDEEQQDAEIMHTVSSSTSGTKKRKREPKKKTSTRTVRYKTVYVIDKVTGEAVPVKKRQTRLSKPKARKRREAVVTRPKTVKKRLAKQLGICAPSSVPQNLPDVRISNVPTNNISGLRHQAGIPTLHLFGQNNELDYFSASDEEYSPSSQLLARRAPNRSDVSIMRRVARRKAAISITSTDVTSSTDLLGSIMNSQEQFHSRHASYSVDSSGKFKIDTNNALNNENFIDLNKEKGVSKETPNNHPNNRNNYNYNRYRYYPNNYNRRQSQGSYNQSYSYNNSSSASSWQSGGGPNSNNGYFNRYGGHEDNDYPQDYTQRTLCASSEPDNERDERENENEAARNNSESELDIYSDIETVTTSKVDEGGDQSNITSPPQHQFDRAQTGTDDDNNDSEPDMVIDDEKVHDENREEAAVTSTVDNYSAVDIHQPPPPLFSRYEETQRIYPTLAPNRIQCESVPSSSFADTIGQYDDSNDGCPNTNIYNKQNYDTNNDNDDIDDNDEGCPNFSIYSKESKSVALHTDLSVPPPPLNQDYQVGEISSSPIVEKFIAGSVNDAYDPAEPSSDEPVPNEDDLYDPEAAVLEQSPINSPGESNDVPNIDNSPPSVQNDENIDVNSVDESSPAQLSPEKSVKPEETPKNDTVVETTDDKIPAQDDQALTVDAPGSPEAAANDTVDEHQSEPLSPTREGDEAIQSTPETDQDMYNQSVSITERSLDLNETGESTPAVKVTVKSKVQVIRPQIKGGILGGLYSDSEDEGVVKLDTAGALGMTEDISEDERSYTPCLDEKKDKIGLEGLDTELISDEDRNDFDESHEHKTGSDGDALEINAKESELELRPEDYEEGEIVDKNKEIKNQEEPNVSSEPKIDSKKSKPKKDSKEGRKSKKKDKDKADDDKNGNKENEKVEKDASFKKLSKSNKERNYRDKDNKSPTPSKSKEILESSKKDKRKEKRKEIERYNVRAVIAEKPRPLIIKDQFGRDIRPSPSRSRSRSYTPPIQRTPPRRRSVSPRNRSASPIRHKSRSIHRSRSPHRSRSRHESPIKERSRKRRRSRNYRSMSRSKSPVKKRSRSKNKKRKRSPGRHEKRKSPERAKSKKKPRRRSRSRLHHRSVSPVRRRTEVEWNRRDWSPTLSMSPNHQDIPVSPSWTPPREVTTTQVLRNPNLTVTLSNENKKKKDKRKREKKNKDSSKRRRRIDRLERTPPPSKEVFASGDNILVSVSFNNENEVRDVTTRDKRREENPKKKKKKRTKVSKDLSGVKPVAIIDLARSPFRELTPSPRNVIVLSDSDPDHDNVNNVEKSVCDSSQQVASPEHPISYSTGPKTPPEPQIKFSLTSKPPQIRAISNPLHEPEDIENNDEAQQDLDNRINDGVYKGPNTPPEPPNSPPSSPDAYDPFEPTKSRSPTPEPMQNLQSTGTNMLTNNDNNEIIDSRSEVEKCINTAMDSTKSLTPPILDIQPADSQSSIQATPESTMGKSPDRIGAVSQSLQSTKPIAQTIPFSSVPTPIVNSAPSGSNQPTTRINIINSTVIPAPIIASSIPQRIVLPNQVKSSPVKIPPTKTTIKSTPIKPMPNKSKPISAKRQNGGSMDDIILDVDSPYSPGSSDYDDLFEPPSEIVTKPVIKNKNKSQKQQPQHTSTFDSLFGSPSYKPSKIGKTKYKKGTKTKTVGVKLDEDSLKILDDLPNSAVEMQVKDKFLKKLNRQERVVEEVKLVLKPHYNKKRINKEEYKEIMRRAVPKICHNKSGEINPTKIKGLVDAYIKKIRHSKKVTSSSSVNNPVKV